MLRLGFRLEPGASPGLVRGRCQAVPVAISVPPCYSALPRLGDYLRADETLRHVDGWFSRRTAFVPFDEAGTVVERPGDLARNGTQASLGLGGRLALLPSARLNARADLAFGREGVTLRTRVGEDF